MTKKYYAKKLEIALRAIERIYYDQYDYYPEDAHKAALNSINISDKEYRAIIEEANKR